MKWYFWVLIVIAVIVVSYLIYKSQMKNKLVEGSNCTINPSANRTAGPAVDLGVVALPIQGTIVNGICVKK